MILIFFRTIDNSHMAPLVQNARCRLSDFCTLAVLRHQTFDKTEAMNNHVINSFPAPRRTQMEFTCMNSQESLKASFITHTHL